jgi:hypothetical protein
MASTIGMGFPGDDCPMRPPPLDIAGIRASKDVKSLVVDSSRRSASLLLRDGSSVRVINMGCQHSGSVARAWVVNPAPLNDGRVWIGEANKLARIVFTPAEARSFFAWASNGQLRKTGDNRMVLEGQGGGEITYSVEVEPASMGMGAWLTISYYYP